MTDNSYTNWLAMSDDAITIHMGRFIKHHRIKQNRTQNILAKEAGISRSTLSLLERGETVTLPTLIRVLRVLDQLHVMEAFNVQSRISPLVLVKMEQEKRQRARSKKGNIQQKNDW